MQRVLQSLLLSLFALIAMAPQVSVAQDKNEGFFGDGFVSGGVFEPKTQAPPPAENPKESQSPEKKGETPSPAESETQAVEEPSLPPAQSLRGVEKVIERVKQMSGNPSVGGDMKEMEDYYRKVIETRQNQKQAPPLEFKTEKGEPAKTKRPLDQDTGSLIGPGGREKAKRLGLPPVSTLYNPNREGSPLTLLISSQPHNHYWRYLKELEKSAARLNINVQRVLSVLKVENSRYGMLGTMFMSETMTSERVIEFMRVMTEGQPEDSFRLKPVFAVPKEYKVRNSPVWIVQHRGLTHVFEGNYALDELYNSYGDFTAADAFSPRPADASGIVYHQSRETGVVFPRASSSTMTELLGIPENDMKDFMKEIPGYLMKAVEALPSMFAIEELPTCRQSAFRHIPTQYYSIQSRGIDFLFYDSSNPDQIMKAEHWGQRAVPYNPEKQFEILKKDQDIRPVFGKMMQLRCLPTRLHFIFYEGIRYLEYREGPHAWDEVDKSSYNAPLPRKEDYPSSVVFDPNQ